MDFKGPLSMSDMYPPDTILTKLLDRVRSSICSEGSQKLGQTHLAQGKLEQILFGVLGVQTEFGLKPLGFILNSMGEVYKLHLTNVSLGCRN